jgi:hypothetical protein
MSCATACSRQTGPDDALVVRRIHAPREDGATFIDPPAETAGALIDCNIRRRATYEYDFQGRSLNELSALAREQLLREAQRYTSQYRDVEPPVASGRLLLAGHQPQLFHPGVWFKNFALGRLAQAHDAAAVNLVIDSDTIKSASIRVPGGSVESPLAHTVMFDDASAEIPYEQRQILNPALFASFAERVGEVLKPLVADPLIHDYWPLVLGRSRETKNLGQCLAQGRHQLEGQWGLSTLEFPQSQICHLDAFYWFAAHLFAQLPRLREIYNGAVAQYRRTYHLRSANHPVPDLAIEGEWLEAPFWIWSTTDSRRRRLFVRRRGEEILLTDRQSLEIALPLSAEGLGQRAVDVLASLPARGIHIRTRALLTTMFARLLAGDLFLHGIGGGKYDELTDLLIARFFGLKPPAVMVLSATLHLPIARPRVSSDDARRIEQLLRELEFHPERYLDAVADHGASSPAAIEQLVATKRHWIDTPQTRQNARARCHEIRRVNAALQALLEQRRSELVAERETIARLLRADHVLSSREYAFCLYPEKTLRNFMLAFRADRP